MLDFPNFMKNDANAIPSGQQNTPGIKGYYYQGADGGQMAFWTCNENSESQKHSNPFDEYLICVSGTITVITKDGERTLLPGDEMCIPKGTLQWGRCIAGTRTIHAFGGERIHPEKI